MTTQTLRRKAAHRPRSDHSAGTEQDEGRQGDAQGHDGAGRPAADEQRLAEGA